MNSSPKNDSSKNPAHRGDFQLARAKRQLEKLLMQEGASKQEALKQVSIQFSNERCK
jgi:hypothetical protein